MFELSVIPPKVAIGPYFATYDGLGFWAGIKGKWECSWDSKNGWISGGMPEKSSALAITQLLIDEEDELSIEERHKA